MAGRVIMFALIAALLISIAMYLTYRVIAMWAERKREKEELEHERRMKREERDHEILTNEFDDEF